MIEGQNKSMKRVLFVCLGNICRSPAAEGIFRAMVQKAELTHAIEFDSCGTGGWHVGDSPDARMIAHAKRRGYNLSDLEARQISAPDDFQKFDYILTMDNENLRTVLNLDTKKIHHAKVRPLLTFCRIHNLQEVPDPYYRDEDGFEHVLDLLEDACEQLLNHLREELR